MIDILEKELKICNLGLKVFNTDYDIQGIEYYDLEWRPPCGGNIKLLEMLEELEPFKEVIKEANDRVITKMKSATARLVDIKLLKDIINTKNEKLILHSGPPVKWEEMCDPQKGAVIGAVIYERWANNIEEAKKIIESGEIILKSTHEYNFVGPMAGITSPSMPVHVLYDDINNNYAYCNINEGLGGVLRFGKNSPDVIEKLLWIKDEFYPVLKEALSIGEDIDIRNIIYQALNMGDECHNRNKAATSLFYKEISKKVLLTNFSNEKKLKVLEYISGNDHYFLNLSMPYCKLATIAGNNIKYSSIVSIMSRNGYEFGIKLNGMDEWFVHQANYVKGLYFPGYGEEDAARDLGDSAITETNGLGGFSMAASPSIVKFVGGEVNDALDYSKSMKLITHSTNANFSLPALNFQPAAYGIDIIKVVETGILPIINTGIAHKKSGIGQIGAGLVTPPMECFIKALEKLINDLKNNF